MTYHTANAQAIIDKATTQITSKPGYSYDPAKLAERVAAGIEVGHHVLRGLEVVGRIEAGHWGAHVSVLALEVVSQLPGSLDVATLGALVATDQQQVDPFASP